MCPLRGIWHCHQSHSSSSCMLEEAPKSTCSTARQWRLWSRSKARASWEVATKWQPIRKATSTRPRRLADFRSWRLKDCRRHPADEQISQAKLLFMRSSGCFGGWSRTSTEQEDPSDKADRLERRND